MQDVSGVLLPAAMAGTVAIAVTVAVERLGGRLGGVLGTLPSTIVPASIGILLQASDPRAFGDAMSAVPVGMVVNACFLWTWRVLPGRLPDASLGPRLALMVAVSLSVWAGLAGTATAALAGLRGFGVSPLGVGVAGLALTLGVGLVAVRDAVPAPRGARRVGWLTLLGRGVLAAVAIGGSAWLARHGGGLLAGMASVFPAIFLTTMVSLWWSQGEAVPTGAVGPMMLGSSSVAAYALLAAWALPAFGPWSGAACAWGCAVVGVTLPAAWWAARPRRADAGLAG